MSGTRKITTPEPIKIGSNKDEYKLGHFVRFILDNHPIFTSGGVAVRLGVRIENAFGLDKSEEKWTKEPELLEDDWKKLNGAAENPPPVHCANCGQALGFGGYPVRPPKLLLPFLDSIAKATES